MDIDLRREYNKIYYNENRERILNYLSEYQECSRCGRKVQRHFLNKHQTTKICEKTTNNRNKKTEVDELKKTVEELKKLILLKNI
jgi:hypothetical protein